jgi:predicted transcriptional regulator
MKSAGFNASRVARECGISPATVSKWLSDDHAIVVSKIMRSRKLWPHFLINLWHRETAGGQLGR